MDAAVVLVAGQPGTGGFAANVSVMAQPLPAQVPPEEFGRSQLAAMVEMLTDLRLVDRSAAPLLGRPGERVLVTHRQGVHSLALEQWWVLADAGPGAVVVSATCAVLDYDAYADDFGRIAASLRVDV